MERLQFSKDKASSTFYREVQNDARKIFGETSLSLGTNWAFWLKALFWFLICWGSYAAILSGVVTGWVTLGAALIFNLSGLLVGFSVGHDASHKVLSNRAWINHSLHFVSFLTVGVDPMLWGLRHIRSHHLYPNVEGSDIDIDKNPLLRLSPAHPWKPKHRFQHIYAPFAYAAALAHSVFWGDWVYLISKDYKWMRTGVSRRTLWLNFLGFKVAHFSIWLLLPYLTLDYSISQIVLCYLGTGLFASLTFIIMLVGTHFFKEAAYPHPDNNGSLATSWAVHNLSTSCDWNPDSALARFMSGGANCHAAHHLFPNICHVHYGKINRIIEEAAEKHSIVYHRKTLTEMMRSHFEHLRLMGESPR